MAFAAACEEGLPSAGLSSAGWRAVAALPNSGQVRPRGRLVRLPPDHGAIQAPHRWLDGLFLLDAFCRLRAWAVGRRVDGSTKPPSAATKRLDVWGWGYLTDPKVSATTLRHGNFDYLTNMVKRDPTVTSHMLPN